MSTSAVRCRFAPSPTGLMHLGNARTALYSWLVARHLGGEFVLRIEDTDPERSTPENVQSIFDALNWLGLDWDGPPVIQSANHARHAALVSDLLSCGMAYRCTAVKADVDAFKLSHGSDRGFRGVEETAGAVRLRVPDDGVTVVSDLIRGETTFENYRLDDLVIARADGSPLFHLAVCVDDADMGVTHVIRGEDHLSNTPKQQLILSALGLPAPVYAHLPLLHGPDGSKLGKRHGAVSVQEYRAKGILSEALVNYLALLGWGGGADAQDTFLDRSELISRFDLADVARNPARFDDVKLQWLNGLWMRELPVSVLTDRVSEFVRRPDLDLAAAVGACREKMQALDGFWPLVAGIYDGPVLDEKAVAKTFKDPAAPARLTAVRDALAAVSAWTVAGVADALDPLPDRLGVGAGKVFQPLRVALTGTTVSPGIHETVCLLSQTQALDRIDRQLAAVTARRAELD